MAIFTVVVETRIEVEASSLDEAQEFVEGWTDYDYFLGADFVEEDKVQGYMADVMYYGIDPYNTNEKGESLSSR